MQSFAVSGRPGHRTAAPYDLCAPARKWSATHSAAASMRASHRIMKSTSYRSAASSCYLGLSASVLAISQQRDVARVARGALAASCCCARLLSDRTWFSAMIPAPTSSACSTVLHHQDGPGWAAWGFSIRHNIVTGLTAVNCRVDNSHPAWAPASSSACRCALDRPDNPSFAETLRAGL